MAAGRGLEGVGNAPCGHAPGEAAIGLEEPILSAAIQAQERQSADRGGRQGIQEGGEIPGLAAGGARFPQGLVELGAQARREKALVLGGPSGDAHHALREAMKPKASGCVIPRCRAL
jgi:hypothetical protein